MKDKFVKIDVSNRKQVPSNIEKSVHGNYGHTERALCAQFPQNKNILNRLEAIFDSGQAIECSPDLFNDGYETIDRIDDLKKALSELLIRFDTSPQNYTKKDYSYLMSILYKALLYLYKTKQDSIITTEWLDPHSDERIPSEKLVKETIDSLEKELTQAIEGLDDKLDQEIEDRGQADSDLSGAISLEEETRQSEIQRVKNLIDGINDLIPEGASELNQLADKQFVNDQIAINASSFRGDWDTWAAVPTSASSYPADYSGNKKPNNNDYLIIQNATDYGTSYTGIWRFHYQGNWDVLGKTGWQPQYRVEQAFTQAQLDAINSGITGTKVSQYDNYLQLILAAL